MHLRDELEVFKPFIQDQKTNLITIMKQGAGKKSSSPSISSSSSESSSSESEEEKDDKNEEEAKRLKELQDEIERLKKLQTEPKEKLDINIDLDNNKGLRIVILSIKGINTGNKFRVENCMFLEDKILIDDINRTCYFRTKPKVLVNQEAQDDEENKNDEAIPYNEEFLYLRNFPAIILMKGGKLELILNLQVVEADYDPNAEKTKMEIPELDKLPEESGLDDKNQSTSYAKNFRVLEDKKDDRAEYQPSAWYSIKLNQPDGTIQYGRFTKNMLVPPSLKPPFDENRIEKSSIVIEYVIEEFVYNAAYLASLTKEKKTKKVKKLDLSKKFIPKEIAATIDGRPFIVNTKKQYEDRPFEKGNGIDFYIDGARFLPDNATVTKVIDQTFINFRLFLP